jgi:hypothetical protein
VARQCTLFHFITSLRPADVHASRKLDEDLHNCQSNCICRASIFLTVQALYDKNDAAAADAYVLRYYSSFVKMPHSMFLLWYVV